MAIARSAVQSSNIKSIGYDPAAKTLAVEFSNGGVYHYRGVPADVHAALMAADSKGKHLRQHIVGTYPHEKQ